MVIQALSSIHVNDGLSCKETAGSLELRSVLYK